MNKDGLHQDDTFTRSPLARAVLRYWWHHPQAQDTVEGIAQWWLTEPTMNPSPVEMEAALAELVQLGLVIRREGSEGRAYYRLNRRRWRAIRHYLDLED